MNNKKDYENPAKQYYKALRKTVRTYSDHDDSIRKPGS